MADRVKVGNAEVAMVWDAEFRYAPAMFIPSMPPEKWAPYLNGLTVDDIQESRVMTFLIRSGGKNILVDAGVGAHGLWRFGDGHLPGERGIADERQDCKDDSSKPFHREQSRIGW